MGGGAKSGGSDRRAVLSEKGWRCPPQEEWELSHKSAQPPQPSTIEKPLSSFLFQAKSRQMRYLDKGIK